MVPKIAPLLPKPRAMWRAGLVAGMACLLSGCYLLQAASGQLGVLQARQPIERVIARPGTSDTLKQQLLRARRIRDFASQELALPDNASYRSYADIGRRYVVWNVVAAPEFSVQPRQWCFPIAGCIAYRGYFSEQAARAYGRGLKEKGDDVVVGGVPAYSTLGRFADPLLNTVTGYGELDLAGLIFHELAHQQLYRPGDSSFNEAFATAVEEEGVARYAARYASADALAAWQRGRRMRIAVAELFNAARGELAALYRQRLAPEAMRQRKAARLAQLATAIRSLEQKEGRPSGYGAWIEAGLNNAHLASVATYYEQVPRFESLLKECGGFLPCLYVRARQQPAPVVSR